jgi:SAM-dependent methyltransferase
MKNGKIQINNGGYWPKKLPELTDEQKRIGNDWMKYWHEIMPNKYGIVTRFNQNFPLGSSLIKNSDESAILETLEIGAGLGEHIEYEDLNYQKYSVLELRDNMANEIKKKFPDIKTYIGDIQQKTEFESMYFDRIIAIQVLEHLPNLPKALEEIHRILKTEGLFTAVIPCEGSLAYSFAREISAKRIFEKRYKTKYDWHIKSEHVNNPNEIIEEIKKYFMIERRSFFPLFVPFIFCNLCIGFDLKKR